MEEKISIFKRFRNFVLGEGCTQYDIKAWECPSFLFLVMGIVTIIGIIVTFIIGQRISTPEAVLPAIFFIALSIFVPGSIIVQSFDRMATANKMKSEFISIVSHQLRSPLSSIKWTLNMFIGGHVKQEKEEAYLQLIQENNERMIKMVDDLLNVSRIDTGGLRLQQDLVDVKSIVKEIVESIDPLAGSKNIKLKPEIDTPKGANIIGDEIYIGMVVTNFLDNAIRYSNPDSEIVVRLSNEDSTVRYEVEDYGRGIPDDEQKLIFNKFFRARNISKKTESGTGLGLFIAKTAIEQMGGRIGFKSKENKGTTFWFELPLADTSTEGGKNQTPVNN